MIFVNPVAFTYKWPNTPLKFDHFVKAMVKTQQKRHYSDVCCYGNVMLNLNMNKYLAVRYFLIV